LIRSASASPKENHGSAKNQELLLKLLDF